MKNKILSKFSILVILGLLILPVFVYAEEEDPEATPTPTPTASPTPSPSASPTPANISVTGLTLNKEVVTLYVDETDTLSVKSYTPSNTTEKDVTWSSSDSSIVAVDSNGKITAKKVGTATITVTSSSSNSVSASSLVTVKEKAKSSTAKITKLVVNNGTLNKTFSSDVFDYEVVITNSATTLDIKNTITLATGATSKITGNSSLKAGSIVRIVVTSEDTKVTNTYTLTIKDKDTTDLTLKSLKIKGYTLNESFSSSLLEYTVDIPYETEELTVQAAATSEDATVSVVGATNLEVGENIITVTVKDKSGNSKVYKIIVNRLEEEEEEAVISTTSATSTSDIVVDSAIDEAPLIKYVFVSIGCFILLTIGGIGIYFFIKTSPRRLNKKNKNQSVIADEEDEELESPLIELNDEEEIEKTMEFNPLETEENKEDVLNDIEDLFDKE